MAYPECILKYLRLRAGMDESDTSFDVHFNSMRKDAVFEEVLRWNGIIGFGDQIREWAEGVYGINFCSLDNQLTCNGCIHEYNEHENCNYCMRAPYLGDYYYRSPPEGEEAPNV